jgi:hypothetical protein
LGKQSSFKSGVDSFEAVSGLKVNFHKSVLIDMNIFDSWLHAAVLVLNCKHSRVPFLYLVLPIGRDSKKLGYWYPLLDRIKKRLLGWKSRNLSMGGCLILLKSVLSSIPAYFFSFFKVPYVSFLPLNLFLMHFFGAGVRI